MIFVVEDEFHAEWIGKFGTRDAALAELRRLFDLPWDHPDNRAPCTSWRSCGRRYALIEYDDTTDPWREISASPAFDVSAAGRVVTGELDFGA